MNAETVTVADHLRELKHRFLLIFGFFTMSALAGWLLNVPIQHILQRPLNQTLYYTSPAGGLGFIMQISLGFGLIVTLPLLIFQIMQFVRPAMKPVKTRTVVKFIIWSFALSIIGLIYAYFISLPGALQFLIGFNSKYVKALINVNDYMQFIMGYAIAAIITFQFPLLMLFANKIRRFPPGGISKTQRPVIAGIVIVSGIITPTIDPINQMIVTIPMLLLYEIGVLVVYIGNKRDKQVLRAQKYAKFAPIAKPITASQPVLKPMVVIEQKPRSTFRIPSRQVTYRGVHMDFVNPSHLVRTQV